jgi:raffinose/stachyose/melibiose transport system permease protein
MSGMRITRARVTRWGVVSLLLGLAAVWVTPFWLTLVASVKTPDEFASSNKLVLPATPNFSFFGHFWVGIDFTQKIANSLTISLAALAISMVMSFFIAYAVSIGRHRWRPFVLATCVIVFVLPQEAFAYPVYLLAKMTGLYGSMLMVIITLGIVGSAFATFLLSEIMSHFPRELLEAARIDGAGRWQVLYRVVLPLLTPSTLTIALLLFVANWNEYLFTLLLLPHSDQQTVPLAVASVDYGQRGGADPTAMAAAAVLGALPSVVIFLVFQGSLVRGITMGASR